MNREPRFYTATLSTGARLVSYGVGVGVWLGVPAALGAGFAIGFGDPLPLLFPVPFAVVLWVLWRLRVTGFRVDDTAVTVVRAMRPRRIAISGIASVRHPAAPPPGPAIGVARIDGFFGSQGRYWTRAWGRFDAYVTDPSHLVELTCTDGRRILVSPDRPDEFAADVSMRLA